MNERQKRFCDEYLVDLNASQAAIRAGYSKNGANVTGSKLLSKASIKAYIKQRMDEKKDQLIADQNEVLRYLTSVIRGESRSSVIVVESTGDFTSEAREIQKAPDEKDKLKAAELIGKRYGIYNDKVALDVTPVVISGGDQLE